MDLFFALVALILVGGAAFFSAAETSVLAADRLHLRGLAAGGDRRAAQILKFMDRPDHVLTALLFGNNVSLVAATALFTLALEGRGNDAAVVATATGVMTVAVALFADIIPKAVVLNDADAFAVTFAPAVSAAARAFRGPVALTNVVTAGLFRRLRHRAARLPLVTREELRALLTERRAETVADVLERRMIRRIFRFGEATVAHVMVPAARVVTLPITARREDVVAAVGRTGYSAFPICDAAGVVQGIVAARDLLVATPGTPLADYIRPALFVGPDESIEDVLPRLAGRPADAALVRDEKGAMLGLVTQEDVVEEIVGEVEDEHSWGEKGLAPLADGYAADGRLAVAYFNRRMPVPLPPGPYVTVGGFLESRLGRVPATGDEYAWPPYRFRVLRATPRSVRLLRVEVTAGGRGAR
jgi:CBS domain containing-hemolysin-like protein